MQRFSELHFWRPNFHCVLMTERPCTCHHIFFHGPFVLWVVWVLQQSIHVEIEETISLRFGGYLIHFFFLLLSRNTNRESLNGSKKKHIQTHYCTICGLKWVHVLWVLSFIILSLQYLYFECNNSNQIWCWTNVCMFAMWRMWSNKNIWFLVDESQNWKDLHELVFMISVCIFTEYFSQTEKYSVINIFGGKNIKIKSRTNVC